MPYKFTNNVKVAMMMPGAELVFEFRRLPNKDLNQFIHATLDIKADGVEKSNAVDELRVALFDKQIAAVYVEKDDGSREELVGEDELPLDPKDLPDDVKKKAAIKAFELSTVYAKNL